MKQRSYQSTENTDLNGYRAIQLFLLRIRHLQPIVECAQSYKPCEVRIKGSGHPGYMFPWTRPWNPAKTVQQQADRSYL